MVRTYLLSSFFFFVSLLAAQQPRFALVIGNGNYEFASLGQTPTNDAIAVRDALTLAGFSVDYYTNLDQSKLSTAIAAFGRKIKDSGGVALFYYSGHGVQHNNTNYLVPIGAEMTDEEDIEGLCVPIGRITSRMLNAGTATNIVILDACRAFPISRGTKNLTQGLVKENYAVPELLVAYATAPGSTATVHGENGLSLYTSQLLKHLKTPGLVLENVLKNTRRDVIAKSSGQQRPDQAGILSSDFYFYPTLETKSIAEVKNEDTTHDGAISDGMVFVRGGTFQMGNNIGADDEKPVHSVTVSDFYMGKYEVTNAEFVEFLNAKGNQLEDGKTWIDLKGRYSSDEHCRIEQRGNIFRVEPGYERYPVIYVSWYGATAYCKWLSQETGLSYRLPTEAEWEYAARNGSRNTKYSWGDGDPSGKKGGNIADKTFKDGFWDGIFFENYTDGHIFTAPVGQFDPNDFGLYDMTGNVSEWCNDWYGDYNHKNSRIENPKGPRSGYYRVIRGGHWVSNPYNADCTLREHEFPNDGKIFNGFRVARDLKPRRS